MTAQLTDDPILQRYRAAFDRMYGNQVERVILFGSRARGDGHAESEYDVAVFLTTLPDGWKELHRLADLRVDFLDETGAFFDTQPYPITAWGERTPLMHEIRRDGVDLCSQNQPGSSRGPALSLAVLTSC